MTKELTAAEQRFRQWAEEEKDMKTILLTIFAAIIGSLGLGFWCGLELGLSQESHCARLRFMSQKTCSKDVWYYNGQLINDVTCKENVSGK